MSSSASDKTASAPSISIRNLRVAFSQTTVLDGLDLAVPAGEIVALVGASGCGKSTLLRSIAKLIDADGGDIELESPTPLRRSGDLAFVFQDATLLPWRTAFENVSLPFELNKNERVSQTSQEQARSQRLPADNQKFRGNTARAKHIQSALTAVGLSQDAWHRYPRQLSGGMKMRVSIARSIVTDPSVMLLDEPFAALDEFLRNRMNDLLLQLHSQRKRTILFVTHNIAEAVYMGHRIAVLGRGKVDQVLENPLPWPREPDARSSVEFAATYSQVSRALAQLETQED